MKLKRISITQTVRHLVQLVAFILFPGLFISTFSALGDIIKALVNGTFSVSTLSVQLITVSGIFMITALWGRFFCGFLCSFGALEDLLALPLKKFRLKHRIPKKLDRVLKYLKFVILASFVFAVWVFALPFDSSLSPWGVFGMLTSGNISLMSAAIPTIGFIILFAIMVASLFVERFFCRYLCPLGAIFRLISRKRLFKIRCNNTCVNCGLCTKKCAMGIDIAGQNEVTSAECIDCMQCITSCPRKSLCTSTTPAVAGTAAALVMCGVVTVGKITVPDSAASAVYTSEEIKSGTYPDGIYTGKGTGFSGDTEVQVTVKNGAISEITVLSYKDDDEFFNRAKSTVLNSILSSQSVDVNAVSGATFSSNGIIEAVANAMEFEYSAVSRNETTSQPDDTQSAADADYDEPEKSMEIAKLEYSTVNINATTSKPDDKQNTADYDETEKTQEIIDSNADFNAEPSGNSEFSSVADGVYQGSGTGLRGITEVSVTVKDGMIIDITVESYADDERFFSKAKSGIIDSILSEQSINVDTVSGATFSSNGIIEAVAKAIGVSFENPN